MIELTALAIYVTCVVACYFGLIFLTDTEAEVVLLGSLLMPLGALLILCESVDHLRTFRDKKKANKQ